MPYIELETQVYAYDDNTAVIEWRYKLVSENKPVILYTYKTDAKIISVTNIDDDIPAIANFVKDSYNNAAWDFKSKGGIFPLCEPNQLDEVSLRLLEAVLTLDLYP